MFLLNLAMQAHDFSFNGTEMYLDGKPFQMIAGEIHPGRVPYQYWRHRIQMTKAMGCNTVAIYIFWNQIEEKEGFYNYSNPQNNMSNFAQICEEEGMYVYLRSGPYICGEWEFGGIPYYLLRDPKLKTRTVQDQNFLNAAGRFLDSFAQHVKPKMWFNGGNILLVQIENEYGSWDGNRQEQGWMDFIVKKWKENGINGPFSIANGAYNLHQRNHPAGSAIGLDNGNHGQAWIDEFNFAKNFDPTVPLFVGELYPGWLRHWGEGGWSPTDVTKFVDWYFETSEKKPKYGFNFYVIHGGTNFGLTAGANGDNKNYQPELTSYDYGSPINEAGLPTNAFYGYRNQIFGHRNITPTPLPDPLPTIHVPEVKLTRTGSLWNQAPVAVEVTEDPTYFEIYNQNQGFAIYRTFLPVGPGGLLKFVKVHDYANIYLNGKHIGIINRQKKEEFEIALPAIEAPGLLEVLIEGMGHKGYETSMENDRKGIWGGQVSFSGKVQKNWNMSRIPVDNETFINKLASQDTFPDRFGGIYTGTFNLTKTGDTYIDFANFSKGMVFVNGFNLGRYWNIGPQYCLYMPGCWLKEGENKIVIVEQIKLGKELSVQMCEECKKCLK